jgi:hypothetical protein
MQRFRFSHLVAQRPTTPELLCPQTTYIYENQSTWNDYTWRRACWLRDL